MDPQKAPDLRPATERQIEFIMELGGNARRGMTLPQASELISSLIAQRDSSSGGRAARLNGATGTQGTKPSARQLMVLKFWGKMELRILSRQEISEWMTEWYNEDPRRQVAWELWKEENGDDGSQNTRLLGRIREGIGFDYLDRVPSDISENPSYAPISEESTPQGGSNVGCMILGALAVLFILFWIFGTGSSPK